VHKLDFFQGGEPWLKWRKSHITATDAPIIMGASPYCTPRELWQRKNGLIPEQKKTAAMQRGNDDEPVARDRFIDMHHIHVKPECIQSEKYPHLVASLDGWNDEGIVVEIKSNNINLHRSLLDKDIPRYHWIQIQHQLICTDNPLSKAFYVSYNNGQIIVKEVLQDEEWQESYIKSSYNFFINQIVFGMDPNPINI